MDSPGLIAVADLALEAKSGGSEAIFTYRAHPDTAIGDAYFAQLGPRQVLGYVVAMREVPPSELGFPVAQLRSLGIKVEGLRLPASLIELIGFVADRFLCPVTVALGLATPPQVQARLATSWTLVPGARASVEPSAAQQETLRVLEDGGGTLVETKQKPLVAGAKKSLQMLRAKGLVRQSLSLVAPTEKHRITGLLKLTSDHNRVESFLAKEGKRKPAQALTLMRLQGAESSSFSPQEIKALSGVTDQTIRALVQSNLLEATEESAQVGKPPPTLNPFQEEAVKRIVKAIDEKRHEGFLLYGITGSGKTEVYLHAAAEALRAGKQVLFLVPEIALTAQVIAQLRDRFGQRVAVLHSNLQPQERLENWLRIATGQAPVVLGARSALFAPLTNVGLIVMDEEHEASYKQESSPRYHCKQVALHLAEKFRIPLILGSATPSIESYYEAQEGRLTLLKLPERAASAQLPTVEIEDLKLVYASANRSLFSDSLRTLMRETLARKEQIILFLNRRAYSPFLMCRDCSFSFKCPNCAVAMALHRKENRLKCHQCDRSEGIPDQCPQCGGARINAFGVGVEKVEEAVRIEFPNVEVARLDRDVTKKKGALEEIFAAFRSGSLQVLVGTQMVAKGLDFPNVTLVGVVAADISLNLPDFRATERTFQLLSQVAGRAGRGRSPGKVVIQTMNPENHAILRAKDHDYESLYHDIIAERQEAVYPPFVQLVRILLTGESRPDVIRVGNELAESLRQSELDAILLGPTDCPIERIQGQWRRHILLKLPFDSKLRLIGDIVNAIEEHKVKISVDVDPYTMM